MPQKYSKEIQQAPIFVQQMCKFVHTHVFFHKGTYLYIIYTIKTFRYR